MTYEYMSRECRDTDAGYASHGLIGHVAEPGRRMAHSAKQPDREGNGPPRTRFGYMGGYSTVDNTRLEALAAVIQPDKKPGEKEPDEKESKPLTDRQFRVLAWYIGASPGPDEPVMKTTADIAERLGTSPDALGRIVRELVRRRLLLHAGEFGRQRFYRVTPYLTHQGSSAEQREAIRGFNPPDIPGLRWPAKGDFT